MINKYICIKQSHPYEEWVNVEEPIYNVGEIFEVYYLTESYGDQYYFETLNCNLNNFFVKGEKFRDHFMLLNEYISIMRDQKIDDILND